jgi:hypothetical protein
VNQTCDHQQRASASASASAHACMCILYLLTAWGAHTHVWGDGRRRPSVFLWTTTPVEHLRAAAAAAAATAASHRARRAIGSRACRAGAGRGIRTTNSSSHRRLYCPWGSAKEVWRCGGEGEDKKEGGALPGPCPVSLQQDPPPPLLTPEPRGDSVLALLAMWDETSDPKDKTRHDRPAGGDCRRWRR